jgi:hypothetical protein
MLPSGEANGKDTPDFTALGNQRSQNHFLKNYSGFCCYCIAVSHVCVLIRLEAKYTCRDT